MILSSSLRDTISLINRTEVGAADDYGNPTMVESASSDTKAKVMPVSSSEFLDGRDTRVQMYSVIVNHEADVDGLARIVWNGKQMEVMGEPKEFYNRGLLHHYEFEVREILG